MREVTIIAAEARARAGKGTARATRRTGRVPGVVYGDNRAPELVSVDQKALLKELHHGAFTSRLFDLELNGARQRVLPRDVQLDPVSDNPVHVDFMRVAKDARIRIFVPVVFTDNEQSPGIKRGGVLNVVRHEIEFYCRADAIPERISISLAGLDIGDSVHISAIKLPDGVRPVIADRDFTIATVAAPTVLTEAEEKPAAAAEGAAEGEAAAAPGAEAKAATGETKAAEGKAPAGGEKGKK